LSAELTKNALLPTVFYSLGKNAYSFPLQKKVRLSKQIVVEAYFVGIIHALQRESNIFFSLALDQGD